jgi:hypothetical protein
MVAACLCHGGMFHDTDVFDGADNLDYADIVNSADILGM